jgi:diaminopimelate decarboxylase
MEHTTPIILYNLRLIDKALEQFPSTEHDAAQHPKLYHSFKANTFPPLLHYFAKRGMGASVSNSQEYALARDIGFHHICATAPSLDDKLIDNMVADGCVVFLSTLRQVTARPDGSRIALRLRVTKAGSVRPSRFGLETDDPELLRLIRDKKLNVDALLLHNRNIGTEKELIDHVSLAKMAQQHFPTVNWVNLGGGKTALATNAIAWYRAWDKLLHDPSMRRFLQLVSFEPGAQHLGSAGFLVSRVIDSTRGPNGRQNAVLDASHWCLNGWSRVYPIISAGEIPTDLYGATCYEDDVWCRDQAMPPLTVGDLVGFGNMGSYITSMARNFCKIPIPKEALFRSDLPPTIESLSALVTDGRSMVQEQPTEPKAINAT